MGYVRVNTLVTPPPTLFWYYPRKMQEGVGGIKPTEKTLCTRRQPRRGGCVTRRWWLATLVGTRRGYSEKDCCVTQRWWLATLVGTRWGLQRKGLLCHTELMARYARRNLTGITVNRTAVSHSVGGSLRSIELDGDYSE